MEHRTTKPPWSNASDEPLQVIEANECESGFGSLATGRFRRLFNEIKAKDAEIERLRGALEKITKRWPCDTADTMARLAKEALGI